MIEKGLSAGDTFTDGGRLYVVTEVLADGSYISEGTEKEPAVRKEQADPEAPVQPKKATARKAAKK